jgi:hypothetical protein
VPQPVVTCRRVCVVRSGFWKHANTHKHAEGGQPTYALPSPWPLVRRVLGRVRPSNCLGASYAAGLANTLATGVGRREGVIPRARAIHGSVFLAIEQRGWCQIRGQPDGHLPCRLVHAMRADPAGMGEGRRRRRLREGIIRRPRKEQIQDSVPHWWQCSEGHVGTHRVAISIRFGGTIRAAGG